MEIFDQRHVSDHAWEKLAQGIMIAFAALSAPQIPEESIQDVIGSLELNEQRAMGRLHVDRIGEEFGPIFVDLSDHGFPMGGGGVIASRDNPTAEFLLGFLDRSHVDGIVPGV